MLITLNQDELETAVRDYVQKMGVSASISKVDFTAGRGPQGITTEIELSLAPEVNGTLTRATPRAAAQESEAVDKDTSTTKEEKVEAPATEPAPESSEATPNAEQRTRLFGNKAKKEDAA